MIDRKLKAELKLYLIAGNVVLGLILVSLITYWLMSIRGDQIALSIKLGQYKSYFMSDLPTPGNDEIEADYLSPACERKDIKEEIIKDRIPILGKEGINLAPVSELLKEYNS